MRWISLLVGASALVALAGPAAAHAMLESALPRVGSIAAAPSELQLSFSEVIVPMLSTVTLNDERGGRIALGELYNTANSRRTLHVPIPTRLQPGRYNVHWRVVSADSHVTQGGYAFRVQT